MNTDQIAAEAAVWAADDRKWNTQEMVERNLLSFAEKALTAQRDHFARNPTMWTIPRAAHASEDDAEQLAKTFHETYERLAPAFNYETRKESAKPWAEVPDTNKKLMIAVCRELLSEPWRRKPPHASECHYDIPYSGICIRGTKGCDVIHPEANTVDAAHASEPWTVDTILQICMQAMAQTKEKE